MRLGNFVILLLCFAIVAYFCGIPNGFNEIIEQVTEGTPVIDVITQKLLALFTSEELWKSLGIAVVVTLLIGAGTFNVMFAFPILILVTLAGYLFLPLQSILSLGAPSYLQIILVAIFQIFAVLAIIDFVRGGGV